MVKIPDQIDYQLDGTHIWVEAFMRQELSHDTAANLLALLVRGYSYLEDPSKISKPLEPGSVADHYALDQPETVAKYYTHVGQEMDAGACYWTARCAKEDGNREVSGIVGLVKTLPERNTWAQKLGVARPDMLIDELIVDPLMQSQGIGSSLMHTALSYSGFSLNRHVALHQYEGSSTNAWFADIGFTPTDITQIDEIDGQPVERRRINSGSIAIRGIRQVLEASHPALAQARVRY